MSCRFPSSTLYKPAGLPSAGAAATRGLAIVMDQYSRRNLTPSTIRPLPIRPLR